MYILTLKGSPDKNPSKIKLTPRVNFSLTSTVRIYPCVDFHFLLSNCSEHSSSECGSFGGHKCRTRSASAELVRLHWVELWHLSRCRRALLGRTGVSWIPSHGHSATSARSGGCGEAGSCSGPACGWAAATAQLTPVAQVTVAVKADSSRCVLAPAVFSFSLQPLQVKVSRCDKLCSSAFLTFHIQKRAQDWEQEGTNLGNNIAEEFTQKYYVIY